MCLTLAFYLLFHIDGLSNQLPLSGAHVNRPCLKLPSKLWYALYFWCPTTPMNHLSSKSLRVMILLIGAYCKEKQVSHRCPSGFWNAGPPWHGYQIHLLKSSCQLATGLLQNWTPDPWRPWNLWPDIPIFEISQLGSNDCKVREPNNTCLSNENDLFKHGACLTQWHLSFPLRVSSISLRKLSPIPLLESKPWTHRSLSSEIPLNAWTEVTDGSVKMKPNGIL